MHAYFFIFYIFFIFLFFYPRQSDTTLEELEF